MTRINVGYPVEKLSRLHLIAEHREIKRIPNAITSGKAKIENIPESFRLGAGHVKFFYNKCGYLLKRYKKLYKECKKRNYNVQDYSSCWDGIPKDLMGDYNPTNGDANLITQRIKEKSIQRVN